MILNSTTDSINIILSKGVTTNQLQFYSSYNTLGSSSITPSKTEGLFSSNTSYSILVPSPSTNQQHQLRQCSIYNTDTRPNTVYIRYSGSTNLINIFSASLLPNETIQYSINNGWQVFNEQGLLKILGSYDSPGSLRVGPQLKPTGSTVTQTLSSGTGFTEYIGEADRSYSSIRVKYSVNSSPSSITWAEIAIYRGSVTLGNASFTLTLCGFADVSSTIGSTGLKTTTINTSGITISDDLFIVFSAVYGAGSWGVSSTIADDLAAGYIGRVTGALRPSTNNTITFTTQSTVDCPWVAWQGYQW